MLRKKILWIAAAIALSMVLVSCNLGKAPEPTIDANALYTAAANTLIAQLGEQQTQTAQSASATALVSPTPFATFTPLPTFPGLVGLTPFGTFVLGTPALGITPLATAAVPGAASWPQGCNDATMISETWPKKEGGTVVAKRQDFKKSWSLLNTGTCTWDEGYVFAFKSGERLSGEDQKIDDESEYTAPQHSQAFVLHLRAPSVPGYYRGNWQMKDDKGDWFGSLVYVEIIVP
jgi:hypothetical protein